MTATAKQTAWEATKAANRAERNTPRGVRVPATHPRPRTVTGRCHDCPHGWKHHTAAGRCRTGCDCTNGADR